MFLIDTVTISESRRPQRDPQVVAWFESQRTADLFLSVISIAK
jgi:predicted nucleic acid-binding protein